MEKIYFACPSCDADYRVSHDLGELYTIRFCVFCGEEIDDDDYDWQDKNEEE